MAGTPFRVSIPCRGTKVGIVASSLDQLAKILNARFHFMNTKFSISLEDGTLVDDEMYFTLLKPDTLLVVEHMAPNGCSCGKKRTFPQNDAEVEMVTKVRCLSSPHHSNPGNSVSKEASVVPSAEAHGCSPSHNPAYYALLLPANVVVPTPTLVTPAKVPDHFPSSSNSSHYAFVSPTNIFRLENVNPNPYYSKQATHRKMANVNQYPMPQGGVVSFSPRNQPLYIPTSQYLNVMRANGRFPPEGVRYPNSSSTLPLLLSFGENNSTSPTVPLVSHAGPTRYNMVPTSESSTITQQPQFMLSLPSMPTLEQIEHHFLPHLKADDALNIESCLNPYFDQGGESHDSKPGNTKAGPTCHYPSIHRSEDAVQTQAKTTAESDTVPPESVTVLSTDSQQYVSKSTGSKFVAMPSFESDNSGGTRITSCTGPDGSTRLCVTSSKNMGSSIASSKDPELSVAGSRCMGSSVGSSMDIGFKVAFSKEIGSRVSNSKGARLRASGLSFAAASPAVSIPSIPPSCSPQVSIPKLLTSFNLPAKDAYICLASRKVVTITNLRSSPTVQNDAPESFSLTNIIPASVNSPPTTPFPVSNAFTSQILSSPLCDQTGKTFHCHPFKLGVNQSVFPQQNELGTDLPLAFTGLSQPTGSMKSISGSATPETLSKFSLPPTSSLLVCSTSTPNVEIINVTPHKTASGKVSVPVSSSHLPLVCGPLSRSAILLSTHSSMSLLEAVSGKSSAINKSMLVTFPSDTHVSVARLSPSIAPLSASTCVSVSAPVQVSQVPVISSTISRSTAGAPASVPKHSVSPLVQISADTPVQVSTSTLNSAYSASDKSYSSATPQSIFCEAALNRLPFAHFFGLESGKSSECLPKTKVAKLAVLSTPVPSTVSRALPSSVSVPAPSASTATFYRPWSPNPVKCSPVLDHTGTKLQSHPSRLSEKQPKFSWQKKLDMLVAFPSDVHVSISSLAPSINHLSTSACGSASVSALVQVSHVPVISSTIRQSSAEVPALMPIHSLIPKSAETPVQVSASTLNSASNEGYLRGTPQSVFSVEVDDTLPFAHYFDLESDKSSEYLTQAVLAIPAALSVSVPVSSSLIGIAASAPNVSMALTSCISAVVPSASKVASSMYTDVLSLDFSTQAMRESDTKLDSKSFESGLVSSENDILQDDFVDVTNIISSLFTVEGLPADLVSGTTVDSSPEIHVDEGKEMGVEGDEEGEELKNCLFSEKDDLIDSISDKNKYACQEEDGKIVETCSNSGYSPEKISEDEENAPSELLAQFHDMCIGAITVPATEPVPATHHQSCMDWMIAPTSVSRC